MRVDVLGPVRVTPACIMPAPLLAKERALLALLALDVGRTVPLVDCQTALWGDSAPRTAVKSLQSHVSRLRRCLGADAIATSAHGYRLALPPHAVDAVRLHTALVAASGTTTEIDLETRRSLLAEAEALWRGEPLTDLADTAQRQEKVQWLLDQWVQVREARIHADLDLGRHDQVVGELQRMLVDDPLREPLWRLLMLALYRSGRQVEALRAYRGLRTRLADEWGVDPSPPLQRLQWQILRQDPQLDPQPPAPPLAIPSPLTPTVGRAWHVDRVAELLSSHRLVTLRGAAGVGKSRLAMEVARALRPSFADGVWWVDLTAASDAAGVLRQVAGTLRAAAAPNVPLYEALAKHVEHRAMLLILDNCEHVADVTASIVMAWLDRAAALRVLATSRMSLQVSGETLWQVPPLEVPDADAGAEQVLRSASVALFLQLRGWRPADVAAQQATEVARLCRALDGLPLAIELAAARSHQMTVREINRRLGQELLQGAGQVARVDHHATLSQAIDWSYSTLSEACQRVLDWLSVFPGTFDAAAAAAVSRVAAKGSDAEGRRCLTTLVESSLLEARPVGQQTRHRQLFVVREFTAARLDERGETAAAGRVFTDHYREMAAQVAGEMNGPRSGAGLARATREMVSLRAAVDWCVAHDLPSDALPLVRAMGRAFWTLPTDIAADLGLLRTVVEKADAAGADADDLAWAWVELVTAAYLCGDVAWAGHACDRAERLFQQVTDRAGLGAVAWHRGAMQLLATGGFATAEEVLREGYRIGRAEGVLIVEAWCAAHLAQLDCFADRVTRETTSAIARAAEIGDPEDHQMQAHLLMVRALALYAQSLLDRSLAEFAAGQEFSHAHQLVPYEQATMAMQACAHLRRGEGDAARPLALHAAQLALDTGNAMQFGLTLQPLAAIAEADGDAIRAAQLWGAAEALAPVWPLFAPLYRFRSARNILGDGFSAEVALGSSLSSEQALALALG